MTREGITGIGVPVSEREFRETLDSLSLNPECGEWDSIRHFNLVMEMEARWGAKIPIEDVAGLRTFDDFYVRLPYRPAKVIAVDADNTLWRGIVSEDGPQNVEPYREFQRALLEFRQKGVFLVLLSKNDAPGSGRGAEGAPLEQAFAREDMPLELSDFAYVGVNWEPKAGNLSMAARALNLGEDSFVFIDDNPYERAQMSSHLPEVMVYGGMERALAGGMAGVADELSSLYFPAAGETREDRLRTVSRPVFQNKPDYLKTLGLKVYPRVASLSDVPRLAQMAGKTKQFNATSIRRTQSEFVSLIGDPRKRIYVFSLSDKFGDMGIVCYVVVALSDGSSGDCEKRAVISDFVMSCRAMGRTLEFFAYRHVLERLASEGVSTPPEIDFVPSAKNAPFAEFLDKISKGVADTYCISGGI